MVEVELSCDLIIFHPMGLSTGIVSHLIRDEMGCEPIIMDIALARPMVHLGFSICCEHKGSTGDRVGSMIEIGSNLERRCKCN